MPFLLDTSVAIALRDDHVETVDRIAQLSARPAISVLTRVELEGGVHSQPSLRVRRQAGLSNVLAILPVIDFTSQLAERYGKIVAVLGFSRRKVSDRMIAATALEHELTLITLNGPDFAGIDGLDLDIWKIA